LQLERRSTIDRLQFLAHDVMIPSALEIHVGDVTTKDESGADLRKALFQPVSGQLEWCAEAPEAKLAKGRQMQTVEIEGGGSAATGCFVKLVLKRNHVNRKNQYNQISLMGVNVMGYPCQPAANPAPRKPHREDLAFLMYTDPDIVEVSRP